MEFTVATLADSNGLEKKPPLSKRLQEITCLGNISFYSKLQFRTFHLDQMLCNYMSEPMT